MRLMMKIRLLKIMLLMPLLYSGMAAGQMREQTVWGLTGDTATPTAIPASGSMTTIDNTDGGEFTIDVYYGATPTGRRADNTPIGGVGAFRMALHYDPTVMTFVSASNVAQVPGLNPSNASHFVNTGGGDPETGGISGTDFDDGIAATTRVLSPAWGAFGQRIFVDSPIRLFTATFRWSDAASVSTSTIGFSTAPGQNDPTPTGIRAIVNGPPQITVVQDQSNSNLYRAVPANSSATVTAHQWQIADAGSDSFTDISGATMQEYTLQSGDIGRVLRVMGTISGTVHTSPPLATDRLAVLTVAGDVSEGNTLTVSVEDGDGIRPGSLTYQWQRANADGANAGDMFTDVSGETNNTYVLGFNDVGRMIRVAVAYTETGGSMRTGVFSNPTAATTERTDRPGSVTVANSAPPRVSFLMTATVTDPDGVNAVTGHQWQINDAAGSSTFVDVSGATESTYTPVRANLGRMVRVVVNYTENGTRGNKPRTITSAAFGPIEEGLFAVYEADVQVLMGVLDVTSVATTMKSIGGHLDGTNPQGLNINGSSVNIGGSGDGVSVKERLEGFLSSLMQGGAACPSGDVNSVHGEGCSVTVGSDYFKNKLSQLATLNDLGYEFSGYGSGSGGGGSPWSAWARVTRVDINGNPSVDGRTVNYEGDSTGAYVGGDLSMGDGWRVGVAVGREQADLDVALNGDGRMNDELERDLNKVLPYADWSNGQSSMRLVLGWGRGDVTANATALDGALRGRTSADVDWKMVGLFGAHQLDLGGGWDTRLKGAVSGSESEVDSFVFKDANNRDVSNVLPEIDTKTGETAFDVELGYSLGGFRGFATAGVHKLFGDLDDKLAHNLGGGFEFSTPGFSFRVEGQTQVNDTRHERQLITGEIAFDGASTGSSRWEALTASLGVDYDLSATDSLNSLNGLDAGQVDLGSDQGNYGTYTGSLGYRLTDAARLNMMSRFGRPGRDPSLEMGFNFKPLSATQFDLLTRFEEVGQDPSLEMRFRIDW